MSRPRCPNGCRRSFTGGICWTLNPPAGFAVLGKWYWRCYKCGWRP